MPQDRSEAPDQKPTTDAENPPSPLQDALGKVLKRVFRRGRDEFEKVASSGRNRLELRQMQKDLDHFWVRLGKTAFHLVEGGEIDHPGLRQAMGRIQELEAQIDELRRKRNLPEAPNEG